MSEALLYRLVRDLYAPREVTFHYRPEFLEGLELDVYVPHLRLGIEYQGFQHFEPVEHWGGEDALEDVRERDRRKRRLCTKNGIRLLVIRHDEPLTEEHIKQLIDKVLGAS